MINTKKAFGDCDMANSLNADFTKSLIDALGKSAKAFYDGGKADFYEEKTIYKSKSETYDNVFSHDIYFYYKSFIVRFTYYPHFPMTMAHSVLCCFVSLEKSERLFYPMQQICGFLGVVPDETLVIPFISDDKAMRDSFESLTRSLQKLTPQLTELSYSSDKKSDFFALELDSAEKFFKTEYPTEDSLIEAIGQAEKEWLPGFIKERQLENPGEPTSDDILREEFDSAVAEITNEALSSVKAQKLSLVNEYYRFIQARSVLAGYADYMLGDYRSALKKFKKLKNPTAFERCLIKRLENAKAPQTHLPKSVAESMTLYDTGFKKNGLKEALLVMPAAILFGAAWLPLFLGLYFLFYFFESRGAVYLAGSLDNAPSVMLPCFLMGIFTIYFKSDWFRKIFFRKSSRKYIELDRMEQSRGAHKFMKGFAALTLAASFAFCFFVSHQNVKFVDTGFYDNSGFFSINSEFYSYNEVDKLYYREKTPDGSGETYDYPSYGVLLKNGAELDLSAIDTCNPKFLEAFKKASVKIVMPADTSANANTNENANTGDV